VGAVEKAEGRDPMLSKSYAEVEDCLTCGGGGGGYGEEEVAGGRFCRCWGAGEDDHCEGGGGADPPKLMPVNCCSRFRIGDETCGGEGIGGGDKDNLFLVSASDASLFRSLVREVTNWRMSRLRVSMRVCIES
jgi:hypothetical protein